MVPIGVNGGFEALGVFAKTLLVSAFPVSTLVDCGERRGSTRRRKVGLTISEFPYPQTVCPR